MLINVRSSLQSGDPKVYIPSAGAHGMSCVCYGAGTMDLRESHFHVCWMPQRHSESHSLGDLGQKAQGPHWFLRAGGTLWPVLSQNLERLPGPPEQGGAV